MRSDITATAPIQVEVTNHPEPKRFELRAAYRSVVLTATNPYSQIAGYDPLRERIRFSSLTNAIVVSGSISQAADPANLVAIPVNPNGRLIQAGPVETITEGQNDVWVTSGVYPTIVGYEIIRKVPE